MRRVAGIMFALMLAWPAWGADDKPKDDKKPSAREQYNALLKDFATQRQQLIADIQKAKGDEQQKLLLRLNSLTVDFADKFSKLAEEHAKDPVAADALFWVLQNGRVGSPGYKKALDAVTVLVAEMPLKGLGQRLNALPRAFPALLEPVFQRAEKDEKDPAAADLLAWVAATGGRNPLAQKAIARLVEKHPDHPALERVCQSLGRQRAGDTLKQILEKSSRPGVKAAAALALGQMLASQTDDLSDKPDEADKVAAEAEKYLAMVTADYGKGSPALVKNAEHELKLLRTLRIGKQAPEIKGADLDAKNFKLSDYRGKVVLLDFWGNW